MRPYKIGHHYKMSNIPEYNSITAIVIGCSVGGLNALRILLQGLPRNLPVPIIINAHVAADGTNLLPHLLANQCCLPVTEAREREPILPGRVYIAPPNYHLLVEIDKHFALSVDEHVCYVRPSIDVLFTTAAEAYREHLLGILLTGANNDGTQGMHTIKALGGQTIVQDPTTAEADIMPKAVIAMGVADRILPLSGIANTLREIATLYDT